MYNCCKVGLNSKVANTSLLQSINMHCGTQEQCLRLNISACNTTAVTCSHLQSLRRESHYGENDGDGDGDVTFRRSHFTFRTVTVAVSLTWRERRRGICCHGDGNGDGQGHVWQMRKRFSVDLANEKVSDGCRSKRSKAKWDSEAERQLTAIWADIKTSTVLHGSCADSDGNSERIRLQLRLRQWFLRSGKRREAMKWRECRSTKYDVRHFLFVLLLRCDRLFAVTFHTVNVTVAVAVIFAVVWLPP